MDFDESSPWADTPPKASSPSLNDDNISKSLSEDNNSNIGVKSPETIDESKKTEPITTSANKTNRTNRGPRRWVTQPTRLETVGDDDPLGPLGPLGSEPSGLITPSLDASTTDLPPRPPRKEQSIGDPNLKAAVPSGMPSLPVDHGSVSSEVSDATASDIPVENMLGRKPPPATSSADASDKSTPVTSVSLEQAAKPTFSIIVGDPHKVGDIAGSHIVYAVRTKTTSKAYRLAEFEVKRRYRDFLWLYNTLHGNHPGVVVPPPPEKQALNRFETNFVESRRAALEKMLNKVVSHSLLQQDPDLKLFLESDSFNVDVKHKERKDPLPTESKGMLSSFGLGMTSTPKFVEQDEWFHERKIYMEALENQLRVLMKTIDNMVSHRKAMAEAAGEFSSSLHSLSTVELSSTLSNPLGSLSDLQLMIRDVYDRQAQQDILTYGIIIDEYIRLIGSVEQAFSQRQRAFQAWHIAEAELSKSKASYDKLLRQGKSQQDRINQASASVADAEKKVQQTRSLFEDLGKLLHSELERFEHEKVEDFKSGIETFLEGAVEAQKELIEKWETFLLQLDADDDNLAATSSRNPIASTQVPDDST